MVNETILIIIWPIATYHLVMLWSLLSSSRSLRASLRSSLLSSSFLLKCFLLIHCSFLLTVSGLLFSPSKLNCSTSSLRENISWGWLVSTELTEAFSLLLLSLSFCVSVAGWCPELEWWEGGVQPRIAMKLTTASGRYPFSCREMLPKYKVAILLILNLDISAGWV